MQKHTSYVLLNHFDSKENLNKKLNKIASLVAVEEMYLINYLNIYLRLVLTIDIPNMHLDLINQKDLALLIIEVLDKLCKSHNCIDSQLLKNLILRNLQSIENVKLLHPVRI
ncbi:hypothetical protein ES692_05965 [Psychroserpens burtonensis]|uniref:Uncharacterized protein n=1 Tax=Psychroserpens burtonensis TaxID=49278 RepID=A0A5C7B8H5_9FLAO|nr:hypothetical protein [Psychroserpens burtonensis]TXE18586.1 hypothetical protein ES692_05965 [Psychroserpens burtonensis]